MTAEAFQAESAKGQKANATDKKAQPPEATASETK